MSLLDMLSIGVKGIMMSKLSGIRISNTEELKSNSNDVDKQKIIKDKNASKKEEFNK